MILRDIQAPRQKVQLNEGDSGVCWIFKIKAPGYSRILEQHLSTKTIRGCLNSDVQNIILILTSFIAYTVLCSLYPFLLFQLFIIKVKPQSSFKLTAVYQVMQLGVPAASDFATNFFSTTQVDFYVL